MQKEIQMVHVMFLAIETGGIVTTLLAFFFSLPCTWHWQNYTLTHRPSIKRKFENEEYTVSEKKY